MSEQSGQPTSPFRMNELDHELEKVWLAMQEEQWRSDQFAHSMSTASMLNSVGIVLLCVAVLILFYVMQKEILPAIKGDIPND